MKIISRTLILILSITYTSLSSAVPIFTSNAHHHSVQYWLKEELKNGNIKGLPILHFDSHTDLGFSPSHYKHNGVILNTRNIINELSNSKINSFQKALTDISQVIIPAIATGISNEIHMCMPDWFTRFDRFNEEIKFQAVTVNKEQFVNAKTHRIYPVTNIKNTSKASPFFHSNKQNFNESSMTFYKCYNAPIINIKSDYILSLDLDILSTNGKEGDHSRPISTYRSEKDGVDQAEMRAFDTRISKIKKIILQLKNKGLNPRIVTIALSTGSIGGNYTPEILAKKADIEFTRFFRTHFSSK